MPKSVTSKQSWKETEGTTLLDAFIYLSRDLESEKSFNQGRKMHLDMTDNAATRYLMRRLDMTPMQVQILACVMYYSKGLGRSCDTDDMTACMASHPLELYARQNELDDLISRGYLESDESDPFASTEWTMRKEAMSALSQNKPFDTESLRAADTAAFLAECDTAIREGRHHDSSGSIWRKIEWLSHVNNHLPFIQNLQTIAGEDELVLKPLVLAAALLSAEGRMCVDMDDFNMLLSNGDVRKLGRTLRSGNHPLIKRKILEPFCQTDGMANSDEWVISRDGWLELLSQDQEELKGVLRESEGPSKNLISSESIPKRQLFFSGKTQEEVSRLKALLHDDQYRQVTARLKEKNMPTGLNILLYGTPGTGKTELVQQLARETGRDIYMVDMAQIRDKYVGESEHNLSRIFHHYSNYVNHMRKTPILFCNECDAIFGSRLERTSGAVDKMENSLQNILLEQMEKMQGIMICTTNLTSTLDKAFERRFLLKIQLPKPATEARKQIWALMLPNLSDEQTTELAGRFDFSGGQIQNVTRKQIINSIFTGEDTTDFARILEDCAAEKMDRSNGHQIGFR